MAAAVSTAKVTGIHHWNDRLFSFTTEREPGFRFENGHFVMIGLTVNGKPLLRAYSIASPNYAEELEFFSIKVENGPLTSRLQHIEKGDEVLIGMKPVGTLVLRDIRPGRHAGPARKTPVYGQNSRRDSGLPLSSPPCHAFVIDRWNREYDGRWGNSSA